MDTLFSHVSIVTMDDRMSVWTDSFLGVTDGKISYLGKKAPEEQPQTIIDGSGMVLMPGLINCHTHLPMTILRGYADDLKLQEWLNDYIFPREAHLDDRAVKAAAQLAIAECLRFGVTSVSDMYDHCDAICEAVAESGIKANISRGMTMFLGDEFDFEKFPARSWSPCATSGRAMTTDGSKLKPPSTPSIPRPISCGTRWPSLPSTKSSACRCTSPRRSASMTSASKNTA